MTEPHRKRRAAQIGAALAASVALLVGLTTLFDWFEKRTTDPPPRTIDARLVSATLAERHRTLDDYLRDTSQSTGGLTRLQTREEGLVFHVRVRLRGNDGKKMGLRWRMLHADGRTVPGAIYQQTAGWFTPANQDHARTVPFWMPYPPKPGRYVVRFTLLDGDRQPLDIANVPFAVAEIPRVGPQS